MGGAKNYLFDGNQHPRGQLQPEHGIPGAAAHFRPAWSLASPFSPCLLLTVILHKLGPCVPLAIACLTEFLGCEIPLSPSFLATIMIYELFQRVPLAVICLARLLLGRIPFIRSPVATIVLHELIPCVPLTIVCLAELCNTPVTRPGLLGRSRGIVTKGHPIE